MAPITYTLPQIDVFLQRLLFTAIIVCCCSIYGLFIGIGLELILGAYQCLHVLYFGLICKKDWAQKHLIHIGIFSSSIIILSPFTHLLEIQLLLIPYLLLVPIGLARWYIQQVRQYYHTLETSSIC